MKNPSITFKTLFGIVFAIGIASALAGLAIYGLVILILYRLVFVLGGTNAP